MVRYIRPKLVNSRRLRNMLVDCSKPAEDATYMYNRNPRNLEMMRIAYRPTGYHLDMPGRSFWNKLIVEKTTRDFTAKVQHYTGSTLLECNTNEWSLAKQLYRPYDMTAYINFGRIFAQRCLEAGIIEMENFNEATPGGKLDAFFKELEKNGLKLSESPQYKKSKPMDLDRMDRPWTIQND